MIDQLDDMFLAYSLMKCKFKRNPDSIFNLPNLNKVISGVKVEQTADKTTIYSNQDIFFVRKKESI